VRRGQAEEIEQQRQVDLEGGIDAPQMADEPIAGVLRVRQSRHLAESA
jgi:hypothetical protein